MKKNLLKAAIAVLAMTMTATCFTSCGDDDDDEDDNQTNALEQLLSDVKSASSTKMTVAAGDTVAFYNKDLNAVGYIAVTSASTEAVTFKINGGSYTLSDADASYLLYNGGSYSTVKMAAAKESAAKVLLLKTNEASAVASATTANSSEISGAASNTVFKKL